MFGRWKEDCINLRPGVVSILIGINDIGAMLNGENGSEPERFERVYNMLVSEIKERCPEALVIIMEPFFGESKDSIFDFYCKKHIKEYSEAAKRVALKWGGIFVPLQDIFDNYSGKGDIYELLWDGVHPTTAGHHLIAKRWKECVLDSINNRDFA